MEPYEIDFTGDQPEETQAAAPAPAAPQKPSPFADAPYEMPFAPAPVAEEAPAPTAEEAPAPTPAPRKRTGKKVLMAVLCVVLAVALVATGSGITAMALNAKWQASLTSLQQQFNKQIAQLQTQIKDNSFTGNGNSVSGTPNSSASGLTPGQVYAKCVQSVVAISNQGVTTNIYGQTSETASSGSGFILTPDGYVVTNAHVVEGATKLTVILHNGVEYAATLVGADSANDIAVLKVNATNLPAVTLGSSEHLIVGDQVVAIGNPLGELTNSLTVGYVSAKERSITTDGAAINMIQTDAAINPGNSGGPLFNMKGEVVGITTAKYSGTTGSGASIEGIGFAIPMNDVLGKITNLIQYGIVSPAYLGVVISDMNPTVAETYGMPLGAYVREVSDGFCAKKAGIQPKDIITELGGYTVTSLNTLSQALLHFVPGDTITVKVWRSGLVLEMTVVLDQNPGIAKAPTE
jgi:serine protease Do